MQYTEKNDDKCYLQEILPDSLKPCWKKEGAAETAAWVFRQEVSTSQSPQFIKNMKEKQQKLAFESQHRMDLHPN